MRNKINFLLYSIIVLLVFSSCDNRADIWGSENFLGNINLSRPDNSTLHKNGNNYTDTVKINHQVTYNYNANNLAHCKIHIEHDSNKCFAELEPKSNKIQLKAKTAGEIPITIHFTDPLKNTSLLQLQLISRKNIVPVAQASVKQISVIDKYEIEIDATKSFDPDSAIGGNISGYEYEIKNIGKVEIKQAVYRSILSGPGNYIFYVRAKDNDGEWSTVKNYTLQVK
ncbi:MAG: hypothetical protein JXB34_02840 [Bacteroidales bacterium]|nr:hypothetical protein [Bacteroidales bacterium]